MSYKLLQFSPQASTRAVRFRNIPERWSSGYPGDTQFLRSWVEDDSDTTQRGAHRRINWGAISGLALSLAISGSFWVGMGLLIARVAK